MGFKRSVIDRLDAALYELRVIRHALEGIRSDVRDCLIVAKRPFVESEAARGRARAEELDAEVGARLSGWLAEDEGGWPIHPIDWPKGDDDAEADPNAPGGG